MLDVNQIVRKAEKIRRNILTNKTMAKDISLEYSYIPKPFKGNKMIKLILIGQDPTTQHFNTLSRVKTVMNIGYPGSCWNHYLPEIMDYFSYTFDNIYATNLYKSFFITSPSRHLKIMALHFGYWIDLLKEEISYFPDAKIMVFGERLLRQFIIKGNKQIAYYWNLDYTKSNGQFKKIDAENSRLCRDLYPFPTAPTYVMEVFYKKYLKQYLEFVKTSKAPERVERIQLKLPSGRVIKNSMYF